MKHADFVHLHNHTQYSLLDGACKIDDLIELAGEFKMPALAITDHGNMFGVIEFYIKAMAAGIKPIIGSEVYVAPESRLKKEPVRGMPDTGYHLVLLVKNLEGYKNLMKLSSIGFLEGFYHRPRVDKECLKKYSTGLIALSSCLKGEIPCALLANNPAKAKAVAKEYIEIFGPKNFYLEIQDHNIEEEKKLIPLMGAFSREMGIPLVATNDCHYLKKEHAEAHDALLCIQTNKMITDADRMKFGTDEMYVKSPQEMKMIFKDFPSAIENTLRIAEDCNHQLEFGKIFLPHFPTPSGFENIGAYLEFLAKKGLSEKYHKVTPGLEERLSYELKIITQMGYPGYFLIVKDFIDYARNQGIPVGPGRGSAAGSLVSYCLGITNIDPIKYDLLFERFLNPERISLPDIDIDFSDKGRDKIIQYVIHKYGEKNVTQIITFGTMAARAVVRDVGRVLGIPYAEVDRIAKMIPFSVDMTIEKALQINPDLKRLTESDPQYEKLISYSKVLEGLSRHASVHAAGVVIAPKELTEFVPLFKSNKDEITTQYDMKAIEEIGLLKMDFLGLRTLTVIDQTLRMLKEQKGINLDLDKIPLDDKKVFELFSLGNTVGIFQFESAGMRDYLRKLDPESINDLTAMNALYRPGPLDSNMIDEYISRKKGQKEIKYEHPTLEPILRETYGVIVYQEQVQKIASNLAGYSLGKADILRKAMGKKQIELMTEQREEFISGAKKNGVKEGVANRIFDFMATFGRYGFNKSHSAGYAHIAYQTAYLKTYYPVEFMAATLTSEIGNADRIVVLMEECKRMGISVLPPDINESEGDFSVVLGKIRFGLEAVKNVGEAAIDSILQARKKTERFKSFFQFCEEVDLRQVNKKTIESLIMAGAFDSISLNRAQLIASVEVAVSFAQKIQEDTAKGQTSFFSGEGVSKSTKGEPKMPDVEEWHISEILSKEKEMLGFYFSGHPLAKYENELNYFASATTLDLEGIKDNQSISLGGAIVNIKTSIDKKKKQMAFVTLEDFVGSAELILFSDAYEKFRPLVFKDSMLLVKGRTSTREGEKTKIIVNELLHLDEVYEKEKRNLHLNLSLEKANDKEFIVELKKFLSSYPGNSPVVLHVFSGEEEVKLKLKDISVTFSSDFIQNLKSQVGKENFFLEKA